jgi:hypothetical protein
MAELISYEYAWCGASYMHVRDHKVCPKDPKRKPMSRPQAKPRKTA